jgi:hypothetical protein
LHPCTQACCLPFHHPAQQQAQQSDLLIHWLLLLQDTHDVDQDTAARHKAYYSPNIWPQDHLPELEQAFKQLGALIIQVGLCLADKCSRCV